MNKQKKLRLLLFEDCNRKCNGCCNNDWDLKNLPICGFFRGYDLVMLTGGEPMLYPDVIYDAVNRIQEQTEAPIILYTALLADKTELARILDKIAGVTVTLHTTADITPFLEFDRYYVGRGDKSLRLNVFEEVGPVSCSARWNVKSGITWIKDCPLPSGEALMRFKGTKK